MHSSWAMLRSFASEGDVAKQKLAPGTARRIAKYASPYKWAIVLFLVLTTVDALLVVATPLLLQRLIDDGVTPGDKTVVITLACIVAGLSNIRRNPGSCAALVLLADRRGPDLRHAKSGFRPRSTDASRVLYPHPDWRAHFTPEL